jgi:hypothetical protein
MELRAVSARTWLTPLAVLLPILGTLVAAFAAVVTWPPLVLVAAAAGLAVTAIAGRRTYGVRSSLAIAGVTLVAGVIAFFVFIAASLSTSICGKQIADAWLSVPLMGGALVYFVVGTYGFRTARALSVVPMALLFGVLTMLVLIRVVPGTPGFCD